MCLLGIVILVQSISICNTFDDHDSAERFGAFVSIISIWRTRLSGQFVRRAWDDVVQIAQRLISEQDVLGESLDGVPSITSTGIDASCDDDVAGFGYGAVACAFLLFSQEHTRNGKVVNVQSCAARSYLCSFRLE